MKHDFKLDPNTYLPLHEVIFNTLRRAVLTGELAPGERLPEIQLASQFGVSRTPVREAIRMLEQEGLVNLRPARGAIVSGISAESVKDVLEIRRALDVLCAQLACKRITPESITALENACRSFEETVNDNSADIKAIAASDVAFHDIIIDAAGNIRLKQLINNLSEQIYRYRFEYLKDKGIYPQLVKEHRTIYEAIAAGDVTAASEICGVHIDNQEYAIMKLIALNKD
ncbi:MAG: GntR family transcriptional regulator [Lachnospiraceae bacterium]|nr:GntR family transcriptional regulator [Lachnospiraceae bacterium]